MLKKLLLLLLLVPNLIHAQIPAYYSNIDFTKTGDSLKTQLTTLISSTHTYFLDYTSTMNIDTWDALKQSDLKVGDTTNVLLVYGYNDLDTITRNDRTRDKALSCHTSSCAGLWNREHIFPQSKANPPMDTQFPGTGTDAHNLRAADAQMNGTRSNRSYDTASGNAAIVGPNFFPGDEWRGDVARIIMYMFVRYPNQCKAVDVAAGSTSYSTNGDMPNILLEWNAADSVSDYERNRNNHFYSIQGNRNPFIDNPYLATRIWNGPQAQNTWNVPLALHQNTFDQIELYPTITTGTVWFMDKEKKVKDITVRSIQGSHVPFERELQSIDLSKLTNGMYTIQFTTVNGYSKNYKIILNR